MLYEEVGYIGTLPVDIYKGSNKKYEFKNRGFVFIDS